MSVRENKKKESNPDKETFLLKKKKKGHNTAILEKNGLHTLTYAY